ncbi:unnamed protein product [Protopolystoma xenopodis]|uniref:Uncharacterized protein n=1 Tax=Protopolystoma xenopodis TaxID=117903 RepID=A0A448WY43_9PLAT|nr:unnamed protein product [Protopolystoma xenopodis]
MAIRNLRLTNSELWDEELEKPTKLCLGSGHPEEAIQRNIQIVMSRWLDRAYERKTRDTNEKLWMSNRLQIALEEENISENFTSCLGRLDDSARTTKRRQVYVFNNRKRHRQEMDPEGQMEVKKM